MTNKLRIRFKGGAGSGQSGRPGKIGGSVAGDGGGGDSRRGAPQGYETISDNNLKAVLNSPISLGSKIDDRAYDTLVDLTAEWERRGYSVRDIG